MRLAWRSRARAELLDAVRTELATTRDDVCAALTSGLATIERQVRSDHANHEHATAAAVRSLEDLRAGFAVEVGELVAALEPLTQAWRELHAVERDRDRALLEVLERLSAALEQSRPSQRSIESARVIGGTITPAPPGDADDERGGRNGYLPTPRTLLLEGVEVRCHFADDRWVGGFEICDVLHDDGGGLRYRLRRRSDGCVLPALFDEASIRATSSDVHRNRDSIP